MPSWLVYTASATIFILASIALFFFAVTRGALMVRHVLGRSGDDAAHVYPIYSNGWLIRMIDYQPIISAILLGQYHRLVSAITNPMRLTDLRGKNVLITSCAFGNVIPRVVDAARRSGARQVVVADIVRGELDHAQGKLTQPHGDVKFVEENATAMKQIDGSVSVNVMFFLLHELPHHLKGQALSEAGRVLAPGGKLYLAEFHRPDLWLLRWLGWTYFKVFEPLGLAIWTTHDPLCQLESLGGFTCERHTVFFGNFQIIVATKH
jgi:ubiquinone/menaquinone biosynthesis C-methylase UbiE